MIALLRFGTRGGAGLAAIRHEHDCRDCSVPLWHIQYGNDTVSVWIYMGPWVSYDVANRLLQVVYKHDGWALQEPVATTMESTGHGQYRHHYAQENTQREFDGGHNNKWFSRSSSLSACTQSSTFINFNFVSQHPTFRDVPSHSFHLSSFSIHDHLVSTFGLFLHHCHRCVARP